MIRCCLSVPCTHLPELALCWRAWVGAGRRRRPHKLLCWQLAALRDPGRLCTVGVTTLLVKLCLQ